MLPFFRKIRYRLAEDNQFLKYSRYAIGEILLVVVGILIALQINNWNEGRKETVKETTILKQLQIEFQSNLQQLDEKIDVREKMMHAAMRLFYYIDHPEDRVIDSINAYLGRTTVYTTYDPILNDLASSGSLRIIENDRLKQMLSFWSSEIVQVKEDENNWLFYRNEIYVPFLSKYCQLRTIRHEANKKNLLEDYLITKESIRGVENLQRIGPSKHTVNIDQLMNHSEFEDHLERCHTINSFTNAQSQILRRRIVDILDLLKSEIGKN